MTVTNIPPPGLDRKRTPRDEKRREDALDESMTIRIDDEPYTLVPADITGLVEMRVRRETARILGGRGMSVVEIMQEMQAHPGMDLIGCFMYACEIAAGRDADLEKILGSVSLGSDFDVVDGEGEQVPQP